MRQISMISALFLVYLLSSAWASTPIVPDPGPENSGLRLRLATRPDQTAGLYIVTVELLNVGPSPGLYGIKAIITLLTKQGRRILLVSNEQTIMIGDRPILPKFATAQIVEADPNTGMVTLDLGSDHRIEPGDSFWIRHMLLASWQATVTEVLQVSCRAAVKTIHCEGGPSFPRPGWKARLEPRSND